MSDRLDLAALLADPTRAADVAASDVPAVLRAVTAREIALGAEQAALGAIRSILAARAAGGGNGHGDRLLRVKAMAEKLGVTEDWLRHNAPWLPFTRKPSDGQLRFSERGADEWIAAGCPDPR
jgi:hypothetical protein